MATHQDDGFELFRRAIVEQDQAAWAAIHERYRVLMIAWARQSSVSLKISEQFEDIADQALARAWSALSAARFDEFPGIAALLAYLRTCVSAVLIDLARAQSTRERMMARLVYGSSATPEEIVLDGLEHEVLWRLVSSLVERPEEIVILRENIVLGLPPRVILARHPELFETIDGVYSAKRNLVGHLARNRELQRLRREMSDE